MNSKRIEDIEKEHIFFSLQITCTEEMLNTLTVRLYIEGEEVEYRFYNVIEFKQNNNTSHNNYKISTDLNSEYLQNAIKSIIDDIPADINSSDLKHYIFLIKENRFDIIAEGFVKENGFSLTFRQQEKIKERIK